MQRYDERQIVTGLKVNRKVNVDRRYIRKTRAMIHALEQDIDKAKNRNVSINGDDCASLEFVVAGRLNFIGMVKGKHDRVYTSLARRFNNLSLDLELPLETVVALGELDTQLHFYGASNRGRLERCVWVVCFEGVENLSDEQQLVQGTAFMLADERMLTCAHVFNKAGNPSYCFVHRIREPSVKYRADLKAACQYSDIAVLSIEGENLNCNDFLKIAKNLNTLPGYRLSVVGFPQLLPGHHSVSIKLCTVTNTFKKSTFLHCEVDTDIHSGSSGGPVLNAYMQVVGMAVTGITATFDSSSDQAVIEGTNAYISAEHFDTVPILQPAALLD
ncbi:MAG: trypsin-like peptidase domain-containing protein [Halieaceae bacterium]